MKPCATNTCKPDGLRREGIERILKALRDAETTEGFQVWHRLHPPADHEYFLSPKASEFLVPLLSGYRPSPCEEPDLLTLKLVPL